MRRPWTALEVRRLGELRLAGLLYKEIARQMPGRGPQACREQHNRRFPAAVRRRPSGLGLLRQKVEALRARGLTGPEIACRLGFSASAVLLWMRRWGIPALARSHPAVRRRISAGLKRAYREGRTNPAMRPVEARRRRCALLGWPEADHPRRAAILAGLLLGGPATAAQLVKRHGIAQNTVRYHLRRLLAIGQVCRAGRAAARTCPRLLWDLTPWLRARKGG